MRKLLVLLAAAVTITGCRNKKAPDVSSIDLNIRIERFDKAFFETMDTSNLPGQIVVQQKNFPYFAGDFYEYILGIPLPEDSASSGIIYQEVKRFYRLTKPLYDSLAPRFSNMRPVEKEMEQAFRYLKYYYPSYSVPKLVSYAGPFDAPGIAITSEAIAIGLQLFAGKDFPFYTTVQGQELYPMYISRRFEPVYIVPNTMKAVIEDMYEYRSGDKPLIEQMIEKGKRWYLLDKLLPESADSLKTDYTGQQLNWVENNEGIIWNFLLQNNDIYTTEPAIIKNYIGEAPTTEGMPAVSPGNIGQWIGWRIVSLYAEKHPELSPEIIMKTEPNKLFAETKYKPK